MSDINNKADKLNNVVSDYNYDTNIPIGIFTNKYFPDFFKDLFVNGIAECRIVKILNRRLRQIDFYDQTITFRPA
ncbi:hypothetical protein ACFFJX_29165 [Pseudarcicella hirudinis]|uniref:hypothetical protein n=1 Tax=Pseudarcicella hirudinis TaxID=1079859 RepID=UPI000B81BFE2